MSKLSRATPCFISLAARVAPSGDAMFSFFFQVFHSSSLTLSSGQQHLTAFLHSLSLDIPSCVQRKSAMGATQSRASPHKPAPAGPLQLESLDATALCLVLSRLPLRDHQKCALLNKRFLALVGSSCGGAGLSFGCVSVVDLSQRPGRPLREGDALALLPRLSPALASLRLADALLGRALSLPRSLAALTLQQKASLRVIHLAGVRPECAPSPADLVAVHDQCGALEALEVDVFCRDEAELTSVEQLASRWPALRVERIHWPTSQQFSFDVTVQSRVHALCSSPHLFFANLPGPLNLAVATLLSSSKTIGVHIRNSIDVRIYADALTAGGATHFELLSWDMQLLCQLSPAVAQRLTSCHIRIEVIDEDVTRWFITHEVARICLLAAQAMKRLQSLTFKASADADLEWRKILDMSALSSCIALCPHLCRLHLCDILVDAQGIFSLASAASEKRRSGGGCLTFLGFNRVSGYNPSTVDAIAAACRFLHAGTGIKDLSFKTGAVGSRWTSTLIEAVAGDALRQENGELEHVTVPAFWGHEEEHEDEEAHYYMFGAQCNALELQGLRMRKVNPSCPELHVGSEER